MRELARRHGPVMLLKFGEVSVVVASSREAAKEVLKTHDAEFATRAPDHDLQDPKQGWPGDRARPLR